MKLLTYSGATLADLSPPARGRGLKPWRVLVGTCTRRRPPRGGVD